MDEDKNIKEIKAEVSVEVTGTDEDENKLYWYSWWPVFLIGFIVFLFLGWFKTAVVFFVLQLVTGSVAMYKFFDRASSSCTPWWYGGL